ncbi:hypothetical protein LUZ62_015164 [Rhynchospora pubera]|uniref:Uncharacterized protein n=1 Tax=Rhynchospora pubera TaxID=906938 RepID=A0AAV8GHP9_9POAL|nr:hypothetical protein LUZ62_015164 [Rhynchospora pubera]
MTSSAPATWQTQTLIKHTCQSFRRRFPLFANSTNTADLTNPISFPFLLYFFKIYARLINNNSSTEWRARIGSISRHGGFTIQSLLFIATKQNPRSRTERDGDRVSLDQSFPSSWTLNRWWFRRERNWEMAEVQKLLYIVVVDEGERSEKGDHAKEKESSSFRYSRSVLQSTLQLMGCKPRHAFKISRRVFEAMKDEHSDAMAIARLSENANFGEAVKNSGQENILFELYKRKTTVIVSREKFLRVVCRALSEYKYVGPDQRTDLLLACRIRERKQSVTILLCGTSGCGKSTLSALLGSRLGITTVVSTDSIRHMMRSFVDEKENPLLWASTYHAGECLDPVEVAKAKAKRRAKKITKDGVSDEKFHVRSSDLVLGSEMISKKQMAVEGYKAQSEMVIDSLDRLITAWEAQRESVIIEGVHLSLNFVMGLMKKHPSIIPFMVYISSEDKHMERFAVRAKYMTLEPAKNKYIKYIRNIRTIQEYLCKRADKHLVPKINNTNVDRSVAAIHATVFSCLRRKFRGDSLYDPLTNTVPLIDESFRNQCTANSLSSKGMFQLIQRKGSSRHLMALVNNDGSVAKAWPVRSKSGLKRGERCVGDPLYGPVTVGSAEPVNLQFGHLGISAWPNDTGRASQVGSYDDLRVDITEAATGSGSRCVSSTCSSPKISDGPAKEIMEDASVTSSDEEPNVRPDEESDEESDADNNDNHDDMEGSVDEYSTKSDEEYEDLALRDHNDNGYWTDEDMDPTNTDKNLEKSNGKYHHNLNLFIKRSEQENQDKDQRKHGMRKKQRSFSDSSRLQGRAKNARALNKSSSMYRGSDLAVTPED